MKSHTTISCFAAAAMMLAAASAQAQPRWGQGELPKAGACFYQDANFHGMYFCVRQGDNVDRVPGGINDKISSIKVFGDADVVVFRDVHFKGQSARFSSDVRNLQREGWNDLISSTRVGNLRADHGGHGRGDLDGEGGNVAVKVPVWGSANMPKEGACFFSEPEFRGQRFCVPRGGSFSSLPSGFNDRIESIRIGRSFVMIFEDKDYDGHNLRLTTDVPNLGRTWNNRVSSLRVN